LRCQLNQVSMRKDEDPSTLFEQIAKIENQCVETLLDTEEVIAVILDAAPEVYHQVLTSEQLRHGGLLEIVDLEIAINQHWQQISKSR